MIAQRWQVEMLVNGEWEALWHDEDDPLTFETCEDARAEIRLYVQDCQKAAREGFLSDAPPLTHFRVQPAGGTP